MVGHSTVSQNSKGALQAQEGWITPAIGQHTHEAALCSVRSLVYPDPEVLQGLQSKLFTLPAT